jgi:uncharacterized protein (DUF1697 family)
MSTYLLLLRGVNVGGKNMVSMVELKKLLERLDYSSVTPYIASGNVVVQSDKSADEIQAQVEEALPQGFDLDTELVKVLILTQGQLEAVIGNKPAGFGEQPGKYRYDAIFLMGVDVAEAMPVFNPREGVDEIWPGDGVVYFQRLDSLRTKSRLSQVVGTPVYKSMTIRSWGTTTKLLEIMKTISAGQD